MRLSEKTINTELESNFFDVPNDHWAKNEIMTCNRDGLRNDYNIICSNIKPVGVESVLIEKYLYFHTLVNGIGAVNIANQY